MDDISYDWMFLINQPRGGGSGGLTLWVADDGGTITQLVDDTGDELAFNPGP